MCFSGSASLSLNTVGPGNIGYDQNTGFKILSTSEIQTSNNAPECIVYLIAIGY